MHLDIAAPAQGRTGTAPVERRDEAPTRNGTARVLVALAVIALLAALGWRLFGSPEPGTPGDERTVVGKAESEDGTPLPPDRASVESAFVEVTRFLATTLERVTDESSARAVLPDLKEAHTLVGELDRNIDALPAPDRQALAPVVDAALEELRPLAERVLGTPGSGAVVEPVLAPLLAAIERLPG